MLKARDQFKEAAAVYLRISGEVISKFVFVTQPNSYYNYALFLKLQIILGTSTFGCNAGASILLLLVCKTTYVTQIWIPSCSFR